MLDSVARVHDSHSGQVADFGMTKQLEASADKSASHSPRTSFMTDPAPTAMVTTMFGTGTIALALLRLTLPPLGSLLQQRTWHQSFAMHLVPLAQTVWSMVRMSTSTVLGAHNAILSRLTLVGCL